MRLTAPLDDLFKTTSSVRIIRALLDLPTGFGVSAREIGRRAGVSHPTAAKILSSFVEQGLVLVRRSARGDEYSFNASHVLSGEVVRMFELERSLLSELISFLSEAIRREAPHAERAFLFGSTVWGDMAPDSDIDVAVLSSPAWEFQVQLGMQKVAELVRARYGNGLNVLVGNSLSIALEGFANRPRRSQLWGRILEHGRPIPLHTKKVKGSDAQG